MIRSNMKYHGQAKISIMKGNDIIVEKLIHNSGTPWLFQILAQALCGYDIKENAPHYLDIGIRDQLKFKSSLTSRAYLTSKVVKVVDGGNYVASFTALIPFTKLLNISIGDVSTYPNSIQIHTQKEGEGKLAEIIITEDEKKTLFDNIEVGFIIMIEWQMGIVNEKKQGGK